MGFWLYFYATLILNIGDNMKTQLAALCALFLCGISLSSYAANEGRITSIAFAGERMWSHPDIVQIQIEGGYDFGIVIKRSPRSENQMST